jgi:hypothetical protein
LEATPLIALDTDSDEPGTVADADVF